MTDLPAHHRAPSHAVLAWRLATNTATAFSDSERGQWRPDPLFAAETADLAAGLIDAYALALHVLWTYQEAWAEEGFLGTARLDESADRLLAQLGYHLGPGTAASGLQHFRCRAGTRATLPPGFAVTSSGDPALGEVDAVYETAQAITIYPELNELRAFPAGLPARTEPQAASPGGASRRPPRPTGSFLPARSLATDLSDRLDDARLGDEAARRAAIARQDARKLGDLLGVVSKHGGDAGACQALRTVCEALGEAQKAAASPLAPTDRLPGALSESQEIVARQLRLLTERQANLAAELEKVLTRCPGESDDDYARRLAAMAAFLDGFVASVIQDARDQVALLRGTDALLRLDRAYSGLGGVGNSTGARSTLGRVPPGTDSLFLLSGRNPSTSRPLGLVRPGDWLVVGEDVETTSEDAELRRTRVFRQAVRILRVFEEPPLGGGGPLTRVTFAPPLSRGYDLDRTVLLGNVVPITHGLTVEERVELGDDPRLLPLQQAPLTFLRDPAAPSGRRPEVSLLVDGRPWRRLDDLLRAAPDQPVFAVELVPGGGARARVGDGREGGAALSAEAEIVLRYRIGIGVGGNRPPRRIEGMSRPHPAIEETFNPLPVGAGADPEPRALARVRGPLVTSAMDRAASAADVRALALAFDGISRARVFVEGTARRARAVVVAAGSGGAPLTDALREALRAHLAARVPPGIEIAVESRRLVGVRARLLLRLAPGTDPLLVVRRVRERLGVDRPPAGAAPGLLDPERVDLDDDLRLSQVYGALAGVEGLFALVVKALHRSDGPPGLSDRIETGPREMLAWASPGPGAADGVELLHEEVQDL